MLSWIGFSIRIFLNIELLNKIMDFIADNSLNSLSILESKAISENNSALMKSYELKLEKYHEIHTIYLFSFSTHCSNNLSYSFLHVKKL